MNIHFEARRRQAHMDKVHECRRKAGICSPDEDVPNKAPAAPAESQPRVTDQGQFYETRSVYAWTGTERLRRQYDRSRDGPVTGKARRELQREFNWRANSLSKPTSTNFTPVDAAFR